MHFLILWSRVLNCRIAVNLKKDLFHKETPSNKAIHVKNPGRNTEMMVSPEGKLHAVWMCVSVRCCKMKFCLWGVRHQLQVKRGEQRIRHPIIPLVLCTGFLLFIFICHFPYPLDLSCFSRFSVWGSNSTSWITEKWAYEHTHTQNTDTCCHNK